MNPGVAIIWSRGEQQFYVKPQTHRGLAAPLLRPSWSRAAALVTGLAVVRAVTAVAEARYHNIVTSTFPEERRGIQPPLSGVSLV